MTRITRPLGWAAAMLLLAAGAATGLAQQNTAEAMIVTAPALAGVAMPGGCGASGECRA